MMLKLAKYFLSLFLLLILSCKQSSTCKNGFDQAGSKLTVENLMQRDENMSFAADTELSEQELQLNKKLIALRKGFQKSIKIDQPHFYGKPFKEVQETIEGSPLFQLLSAMPKGALLHTHSGGLTDIGWVIDEAKEMPNCYVYCKLDNKDTLYGQLGVYKKGRAPAGYVSLKEKIKEDPGFYLELYNLLTLNIHSGKETVDIWSEFEKRFKRLMPLLHYRPFFKQYYRRAFLDLLKDNISHVEIRFICSNLFDEENPDYPKETQFEDFGKIVADIQKTRPNFSLKLIYTSFKFLDVKEINLQIEEAFRLKKKYPDLIAGFDLVAEEDRGNSIDYYKACWKKIDTLEKRTGLKLPLFLHAGESNSINNKNLYDAVTLKPKRIGHGLNLWLYPSLVNAVKKNDILIEVNPISNQILGYVADLRNHPARMLLANGVECAISSDDSGVFGYEGLSYDYFMICTAWELDVKALKKLVFNSIGYSALNSERKKMALQRLEEDWIRFVAESNMRFKI